MIQNGQLLMDWNCPGYIRIIVLISGYQGERLLYWAGRVQGGQRGIPHPPQLSHVQALLLQVLTCSCTCRGIPIAPSRRMLETLLLDEDSLLLTWSISTVLQIFNAVLCNFLELFFIRFFFFCIWLFPLVFHQSFELLNIFVSLVSLQSLFHSSATLTLKLFLLTSVLAYGTCKPGLVVLLLTLFLFPWFWQFLVACSRTHHCCCRESERYSVINRVARIRIRMDPLYFGKPAPCPHRDEK